MAVRDLGSKLFSIAMASKQSRLSDEVGVYIGSVLAGAILFGLFILLAGGDVLKAYGTIIEVSLGSSIGIAQTLNKWTPLLLGSLAVALGNKSGVINIGVDGQIFMGATIATGIAFALGPYQATPSLFFPVILVAGLIGGCLYAGIAGLLKGWLGVNEIFVTVMMNFIAVYIAEYFASGPWNDLVSGGIISIQIPSSAFLPIIAPKGDGHIGIVIALSMVFVVYFLLEKTLPGFSMKAVGSSPIAAMTAGINYRWVVLGGLSMSGALAGLAGAIEVSGVHHCLIGGLSPNYGIMAIILAAVGKNNPIGIVIASLFFAVLLVGSDSLQRSIGLPASAVIAFQGVIFLFILAGRILLERNPSGMANG